jgi:hypothetical protein
MSAYTELAEALTEQWIAGLQQLQQVQTAALGLAVRQSANLVPDIGGYYGEQVAQQREVVETNFRLGTRLLTAHRDYLLGLVDATRSAAADASSSSPSNPRT